MVLKGQILVEISAPIRSTQPANHKEEKRADGSSSLELRANLGGRVAFGVGEDCFRILFGIRYGPMIPTHRRLEYASGYIGLGMHRDAEDELRLIAENENKYPEALRLWVALYHETKEWLALINVAETLVGAEPDEEHGWISWAYALRELNRVKDAQEVLLQAEVLHGKSCAVLHYNLACYACLLEDPIEAKRRLATAFEMDADFKNSAKEDPDLEALRGELEGMD